jgi:hypothetical protein
MGLEQGEGIALDEGVLYPVFGLHRALAGFAPDGVA